MTLTFFWVRHMYEACGIEKDICRRCVCVVCESCRKLFDMIKEERIKSIANNTKMIKEEIQKFLEIVKEIKKELAMRMHFRQYLGRNIKLDNGYIDVPNMQIRYKEYDISFLKFSYGVIFERNGMGYRIVIDGKRLMVEYADKKEYVNVSISDNDIKEIEELCKSIHQLHRWYTNLGIMHDHLLTALYRIQDALHNGEETRGISSDIINKIKEMINDLNELLDKIGKMRK